MKYLYSWLKELYPETPPLAELEPLLIQLGHDVETVTPIDYPGVIVAEIISVEPHPNADKLTLVTVFDGTTTHSVVCGAPDLRAGQKVAYATIGTSLPCGLTLKATKIRGVESDGMLCAEDELGIGTSHASLLPLPSEAAVGHPIAPYVAEDALLSIDITPNRGDVLSHFGLARDIKAVHANSLLEPRFETPYYSGPTTEVVIDHIHPDAEQFALGLVEITVNRTPLYIQSRLALLGQKPINLPTDITNYLLLAYGQPLHAYDRAKLEPKATFGVRRAHEGEIFHGLNGQTYRLNPQSLLVTANDKPAGLAGILGGEETKTSQATNQVILESAHFYAKSISVMVRGLNLFTEGAIRWERGVDPTLAKRVLAHAQALLVNYGDGKAYTPIHQDNKQEYGTTPTELDVQQVRQMLGIPIESERVRILLTSLGCAVETDNLNLTVTPPLWRTDLAIPEDYIEEVARLIGLQNLPKTPLAASVPQWKRSPYWREEHFKDTLTSLDAHEIATYPFSRSQDMQTFSTNPAPRLELTEAAMENRQYLRDSLIPGMLEAIAANPETPFFVLFEIAKVFLDQEVRMICLSVSGNNQIAIDSWWQNLFERLRLPVSSWMSRVKTLDDSVREAYKIRKSIVTILELPVEELQLNKSAEILAVTIPDLDGITYTPLSKFQTSKRDIAFTVDTSYNTESIAQELIAVDPHIVAVELFDIYKDAAKLGPDKQSLAYHVVYQAADRTLTSEEIQTIHNHLVTYIEQHYQGEIR